MSNYIEYNDTVAFHSGYYIKEIVEESGFTQEELVSGATKKIGDYGISFEKESGEQVGKAWNAGAELMKK